MYLLHVYDHRSAIDRTIDIDWFKVKENSSFCSQGSGNQFLVLSVALSSLRFSSFSCSCFVVILYH